jgi:alpha-L-fucosidase
MAWWREARFGMFIHWGVYSVPAGFYHGKPVPGIGEWIMNHAKIPCAEYQSYAKEFNPVKFDADAWVKAARDAGMKYIVITAKHHDGFAMFATQASDWSLPKASPFHRDPLKELAAACRKYGVKLGFYYSQAQDWNNGGAAAGGKWDPAQEHSMDDYIDKIAVPQMKELLSNYGEFPAVLWWDTPVDMNRDRAAKLIEVLKLKPGIIHNNRLGGGFRGDTETPEQYIPATGYPGRDWETCMTMNDTWGFKSNDHNWKSAETLIRNLVDIASKGGNYLLNVGPTREGLIPEPSLERLQAVGAWMKVNGPAIYGTTASPFKRLAWGRCTKIEKGNATTLFLHVFDWPADGKLTVPGLKNKVVSAALLASGQKLATEATADGVSITVPASAPDAISSTIVLNIVGAPEVVAAPLLPEKDGTLALKAADAELHGELQYESGRDHNNIGFWTNPDDFPSWTIKVERAGQFTVSAEMASLDEGRFDVLVDGRKLSGTAPNTGDYGKFRRLELGTLEIAEPGQVTIAVKPVKEGWAPINLRALTFKPVAR